MQFDQTVICKYLSAETCSKTPYQIATLVSLCKGANF